LPASPQAELGREDLLSKSQREAHASGDEEAIRQADEAALKEAIDQSRESYIHKRVTDFSKEKDLELLDDKGLDHLQDTRPNTVLKQITDNADLQGTPGNPSLDTAIAVGPCEQKQAKKILTEEALLNFDNHMKQLRLGNSLLQTWLNSNCCDVVHNDGNGNNCLIISLLQLATRDLSQHKAKAEELKQWLVKEYPGEADKTSDKLYSNTTATQALIEKINDEYHSDMTVTFLQATADGFPVVTSRVGKGSRHVMIFDKGGHFQAVAPKLP
jgi:hypothetical protein